MRRDVQVKFMLGSLGTLGDLLPFLELGTELLARGYACHMLGSAPGARLAQEQGLEYSTVSPARVSDRGGTKETFDTYVHPSYEPTFRIFERELAAGNRLVVVNQSDYSATTLMCERYALPLARVILAPALIDSLQAPPMPWRAGASGPLGKAYTRHFLPALYRQRDRDPHRSSKVNAHRHALGLPPLESVQELQRLVQLRCAFFPDWFAPRAGDWPELELVGFPLPRARGQLPEALSRWIQIHGAPLVFTPGTGVSDVERFFAEAARCCALLQRPGVLLSPRFAGGQVAENPRVLALDYVDLALLLPHAALLVHHGGIGTTARALQAGIPQIICPHGYDQPDNGARVADLGVGAVLGPASVNAESLAATARALLASERVVTTLSELAARVSRSSALARAADLLLERFAGEAARAAS